MPDRYGNTGDDADDPAAAKARAAEYAQAARDAALEARHAELDAQAQARANCTLCDTAGYRQGLVCDHIDRSETTRRGIEACQAALRKDHTR